MEPCPSVLCDRRSRRHGGRYAAGRPPRYHPENTAAQVGGRPVPLTRFCSLTRPVKHPQSGDQLPPREGELLPKERDKAKANLTNFNQGLYVTAINMNRRVTAEKHQKLILFLFNNIS